MKIKDGRLAIIAGGGELVSSCVVHVMRKI